MSTLPPRDFGHPPGPLHGALHGWNSKQAQLKLVRAVAAVELAKGIAVVVIIFGLVALMHSDTSEVAASILRMFHINPTRQYAQNFLDWAGDLTDAKLRAVAWFAVGYSTLRFIEGFGLWHARAWAEWLAIVSGMIYLPLELYELIRKHTVFHWILLLGNVAIVAYMIFLRASDRHARHSSP